MRTGFVHGVERADSTEIDVDKVRFRHLSRIALHLWVLEPGRCSGGVPDVEERSIEKSEYSSTEFQGFVGLTPGKPISMISQSCCRIAIADRPSQWFQPTGTSL